MKLIHIWIFHWQAIYVVEGYRTGNRVFSNFFQKNSHHAYFTGTFIEMRIKQIIILTVYKQVAIKVKKFWTFNFTIETNRRKCNLLWFDRVQSLKAIQNSRMSHLCASNIPGRPCINQRLAVGYHPMCWIRLDENNI